MQEIKIGDLFYTSWGYDQTNIEFILVESISPSGKTCMCRMAKSTIEKATMQTDGLKPLKEAFGKPFRMKIEQDRDGNPQLRGSYYFCQDYKRLGTAWLCENDKLYWETNSQFGH